MIYSKNNGTIMMNEGLISTAKKLFKRKNSKRESNNKKVKINPLDNSTFNEYKNKIFSELKNICKSYNDKDIYPEILEDDGYSIIYTIMHHDQDFRIKNIDILYDIADKLKQTNIYKDIKSKAYIFIDFGDGDEGCLYIDIWTHANEQPIKESTIFRYADLI